MKKKRAKKHMKPSGAANATAPQSPPPIPAATEAVTAAPSIAAQQGLRGLLRKLAGRRTTWLILVCLLAGIGFMLMQNSDTYRPGIVEYSSDDPDAVVILKCDGKETNLTGNKEVEKVAPGKYKLRLKEPNEGLKLQPLLINMDHGGRAFVTVRRVQKAP